MSDNFQKLAAIFDVALNQNKEEKEFGFALFVFPLKPNIVGKTKTQYISNITNRRLIVAVLRDALERLEK